MSLPAFVWSRGQLHRLPPGLVLGAPGPPGADGPLPPAVVAGQGPGRRRAPAAPLAPDRRRGRHPGPGRPGPVRRRGARPPGRAADRRHQRRRPRPPEPAGGDTADRRRPRRAPQPAGRPARAGPRRRRGHLRSGAGQPVPRPARRRERPRRAAPRRGHGSGRRGPHGDAGGRARAPGRPVDGPARVRARRSRPMPWCSPSPPRTPPPCWGTSARTRRPRCARSPRPPWPWSRWRCPRTPSPAPSRPVATWCPAPSNARSRPAPGDRRSGPSGGSPARWSCASPPAATGTSGRSSWATTTCWRPSSSDLDRHIGLRGQPTATRITRWWDAMPQYAPGHVERVDALTATPGPRRAGAVAGRRGVPGAGPAGLHRAGPGCSACRAGHGRSGMTTARHETPEPPGRDLRTPSATF